MYFHLFPVCKQVSHKIIKFIFPCVQLHGGMYTVWGVPPVALGFRAIVSLCSCRKRHLIIGYKLFYTTSLLYAWSSCMH